MKSKIRLKKETYDQSFERFYNYAKEINLEVDDKVLSIMRYVYDIAFMKGLKFTKILEERERLRKQNNNNGDV